MRFFYGDGLQQEFESGEQKGGNVGCFGCSGDVRKYKYLFVLFFKLFLLLTDCLRKVF